jgi:hypothetical protein
LFFISLLFIFPIVLGQSNVTKTIFKTRRKGITFHYPSDWKATTIEYVDTILGDKDDIDSRLHQDPKLIGPLFLSHSESMDGSSFLISAKLLPFPVPIEK